MKEIEDATISASLTRDGGLIVQGGGTLVLTAAGTRAGLHGSRIWYVGSGRQDHPTAEVDSGNPGLLWHVGVNPWYPVASPNLRRYADG